MGVRARFHAGKKDLLRGFTMVFFFFFPVSFVGEGRGGGGVVIVSISLPKADYGVPKMT